MTDHLLLFARDPGATNQILALMRLMAGDVPDALRKTVVVLSEAVPLPPKIPIVTMLAKDYASQRLPAENIPIAEWEELSQATIAGRDQIHALQMRIKDNRVTHVVTGVSDNDDKTHQKIWRAAHQAGIPCATLLDDDTSVAERFTDELGNIVWPDRIYAVSDIARATLTDLGVPATAIYVIANLHIASLIEEISPQQLTEARALRAAWGADGDDRVVLFASEPIREMCAFGKPANYDEFACLRQLARSLNRDSTNSIIVIRPHPRDVPEKYDGLAGAGPPRTIISDQGSSIGAILAADAVAGMNSMLLNEAEALSRPVIHLNGEEANR